MPLWFMRPSSASRRAGPSAERNAGSTKAVRRAGAAAIRRHAAGEHDAAGRLGSEAEGTAADRRVDGSERRPDLHVVTPVIVAG